MLLEYLRILNYRWFSLDAGHTKMTMSSTILPLPMEQSHKSFSSFLCLKNSLPLKYSWYPYAVYTMYICVYRYIHYVYSYNTYTYLLPCELCSAVCYLNMSLSMWTLFWHSFSISGFPQTPLYSFNAVFSRIVFVLPKW